MHFNYYILIKSNKLFKDNLDGFVLLLIIPKMLLIFQGDRELGIV